MKNLLILRHAKSSWKKADLADQDRPLSKRGKRDAARMGQLLHRQGLKPRLAISSTAKRARTTLERLIEAADLTCEARLEPELYMAGPREIIGLLRQLPDRYARVMVVGHNPGLEDLVQQLTGEAVTLPTAALVLIDCRCRHWRDLGCGERSALVQAWTPKDLSEEAPTE
jgi:phosphohistidine phosphatase